MPSIVSTITDYNNSRICNSPRCVLQLRVLGLLQDGNIGVTVFPEREVAWDGSLMAWILAAEQRQSHSGRAKQRDSFHPATS